MYRYHLSSEVIKDGFHKDTNVLVFEDSSLSCHSCDHIYSSDRLGLMAIQIENTDTKNLATFFFDYYDKNHGEIMGTNYKSRDGKLKLLIIND